MVRAAMIEEGEMGLAKPYSLGPYNKVKNGKQWIRLTEGCPHNCPFCYEPQEIKVFDIPQIRSNKVKIMDMNLLCKPEALKIIKELSNRRFKGGAYELICGIDYRFLTDEIAKILYFGRFANIRLAWDWYFADQMKINDAIKMLIRAGYKSTDLMIFMICNWQISYEENCRKLDLLKIWRVKVADCWFDNQYGRDKKPIWWSAEQIKSFRHKCRVHNQMVVFGIDPKKQEKKPMLNPAG
jgi:hypothetical protein